MATEVVTNERFVRATAVLGEGASSRSSNPGLENDPLSILLPQGGLSWLSAPAALWELVPNLVGGLTAWIISHIGPIDEALDQLTGDADELQQTSAAWSQTGQALDLHASAMVGVGSRVTQSWTGDAADAFTTHNAAEQGCARAATGVFETMGTRLLGVGDYVGNARKSIIAIASKLIGDLVRAAIRVASHWWKPWAWASAISDFIAWALDFIANTLREIAAILQDVVAQGTMLLGQIGGMGQDLRRAASILRDGSDPGLVGDVADGSFGDTIQGDTRPQDRDLMRLTNHETVDGYTPLTDDQLRELGIDPALLTNDETGFVSKVFRGPSGELVVMFEGTDFGTVEDVTEDLYGTTVLSGQSADASRLAQALNGSPAADDVIYTGYSLGGRLAAVASMTSGNGAVTFNAAGVSPATLDHFAQQNRMDPTDYRQQLQSGQVRLYTTADDPLTNVQEDFSLTKHTAPDAVGQQYYLGGDHNWVTEAVDGHDMDNVIAEYDEATPVGAGDRSLNPE
ncbi:alpha/beta hydrolase family protein [Aestuariimicrobium ganziense]|uniref:hypothetical protein n=1 Tax=Aestuariimicrobium ganziense TaxID=2773677 RepID=UPI001944F913|nr:hypothetical protein [Aestuariimicrobium ganziense]